MLPLFQKFFGKTVTKTKTVRTAANSRALRLEPLEERQMLSVSPLEFDAIRAQYSDLNLSANMGDYHVIEITAEELSILSLRNAITEAGNTAANDLIVVRTTAAQNKITLGGSEIAININATTRGSVTIVSLGDERLTIDGNRQSRVFNITSSTVAMAGLNIINGSSTYNGGGILASNSLITITDCSISGNTGYNQGGGIHVSYSTLTITNSIISRNKTTNYYGGGISVDGSDGRGKLSITNCTISGNTSSIYGGGIYTTVPLTVTNSTISENTSSAAGGGIYVTSSLTITNSTIFANTVISSTPSSYGGGIYATASLTITNSTITKNSATSNSGSSGGGIYTNGSSHTFSIRNSTIAGNFATNGSGIYHNAGTMNLYNTIVAQNSSANIYKRSSATINGYNTLTIFADWNGGSANPAYDSAKPLFVNAANGDYRLTPNSQAIDKGNNAYVTTQFDLAGNPRIVNGTVDIGAYEYQGEPDIVAFNGGAVTLKPDGTFRVTTGLIENIGTGQSGEYTVTFYVSAKVPTASTVTQGTAVGSVSMSSLNVGASVRAVLDNFSTASLYSGNYYVGWAITNVNGEVVKNNNAAYLKTPFAVVGIAGEPDIAASNGGAVTLKPDGTFRVTTGLIENIGTTASGEYTVTFYVSPKVPTASTVTQGTVIGSVTMSRLNVGASVRAVLDDFNAASLYSGNYYVGWAITNVNGEIVTNNNAAYFKTPFAVVGIAGEPDIAASNGGAVTLKPDGTFRVTTGLIENIGTAPTGEYTVTFYVSAKVPTASTVTQGTAIGSVTMSSLNVGASVRAVLDDFNAASLYSGNYYVGWAITNVSGEVVTNNNAAYFKTPFAVVGIAGEPDIAASNGGAVTLKPDGTFRVTTGTMQNIGTTPTGEYTVTFYVSAKVPTTSTVTQGTAIGSVTMSSLNVGASVRAVLDDFNAASFYSGNYYVGWAITNVSGEVVTNNNAAYFKTPFAVVGIAGEPDIAASNGGAVTLKPDGTFRITTGTIQNIGTAPTGEYTVTFYVSAKVPTTSTVTQGTNIGSVTMSSLNVGASVRAVLDDFNAASLYSGNYYVGWAITNVSGEVVTNNNAAYFKTPFAVVAAKAAPALTPPQTDSFTKPLPSISDFALTSLLDEGVLF